ncbi:hypothetical protein BH11PLA2_BH11PLA2_42120 [soil metagenome]
MKRVSILLLLMISASLHAQAPKLETTAERTRYLETTSSTDVVRFCEDLAKQHPQTVRYSTYGSSHSGKALPLLILGEAVNKPRVLVYANIHAGEVDGKEAVLALARDLAGDAGKEMRKSFTLLIAPNINPDGNDALGDEASNRPGQNGPAKVGTRENAQGLDLNRDFIKLESPEIRALVKLVNERDPLVIVDCHTTNGSKHRFAITYDGPRHAAASSALIDYSRETFLPAVTAAMNAKNLASNYYGNFNENRTEWETYPTTPRFGTQYFALRGRLGLLSESYTYDSFEKRVIASSAFVEAVLNHAAKDIAEIKAVCKEADKYRPKIALQTKLEKFDKPTIILGYEEKIEDGKRVATATPKEYLIPFVGHSVATLSVDRPAAYFIPKAQQHTVETLQRHGIKVDEIREEVLDLDCGFTIIDGSITTTIPKPKTTTTRLTARAAEGKRNLAPGDFLVRTAQPLGSLAVFLLEAASEDGFGTWMFFKDETKVGSRYPIERLATDAVFTGSPRPLSEDQKKALPITPETWYSGTSFGGTPVGAITWLPDGLHFLQSKHRKLVKVDAFTGRVEPIFDAALFNKSLATITGLQQQQQELLLSGAGLRFLPDYTAVLVNAKGNTWVAHLDGKPAKQLTKGTDVKEFVTLAPDGKSVAYVKDGNLFSVDLANLAESQYTSDGGKNDILNGKADWVYFEEIFSRNYQTFWWSPKSDAIAFLRFDDTKVKKYTIADPSTARGKAEVYAYPKVGDPNPTVKLGIARLGSAEPVFLDLSAYKPEDMLISGVGWTPDGKVYACIQNRTQTWLDFVVWTDGKPKVLFRETSKAWIEEPDEPRFLKDGSFLWLTDRMGHKHIWRVDVTNPAKIEGVTSGDWSVKDIVRVDEDMGMIYFTSNKDNPNGLDLYSTHFEGILVPKRITVGDGTHTVNMAPKGNLFIDRFSDNTTPTRTTIRDFYKTTNRVLDSNPAYEREAYTFGKYERLQIPMSDGVKLEAGIVYPPNFDPAKSYPVWINTYAGPHAPQVRDSFGTGRVYSQMLAAMGIVSVTVDPRSASGKSAADTWTCFRQLGVQELKDLDGTVDWLAKQPWCDAKRVGLQGHSYGGYITCYALTHSTKFAAGIAGAPVTDWRLYDSIYTERYMGLPDENAAGYEKSSCIAAAANLSGKLLILHGQIDDNVHVQNTLQFADALQKANKPFEMMIYPRARHGIFGRHYQEIQVEFIKRVMLK